MSIWCLLDEGYQNCHRRRTYNLPFPSAAVHASQSTLQSHGTSSPAARRQDRRAIRNQGGRGVPPSPVQSYSVQLQGRMDPRVHCQAVVQEGPLVRCTVYHYTDGDGYLMSCSGVGMGVRAEPRIGLSNCLLGISLQWPSQNRVMKIPRSC